MRKLIKVLKIAKLEGRKPDLALNEFLASYHDTPHSATGVAPNVLMFGRAMTSGLPVIENKFTAEYQALSHKKALNHNQMYVKK